MFLVAPRFEIETSFVIWFWPLIPNYDKNAWIVVVIVRLVSSSVSRCNPWDDRLAKDSVVKSRNLEALQLIQGPYETHGLIPMSIRNKSWRKPWQLYDQLIKDMHNPSIALQRHPFNGEHSTVNSHQLGTTGKCCHFTRIRIEVLPGGPSTHERLW